MISAATLVAGSTVANSCGYEDAKSADVARGVLNWTFPHALYVTSAVWRAQSDGVIPRNESPPSSKALLGYGYRKAVRELDAFRDGLSIAVGGLEAPAFSVVLIGPMLWARFETTGTILAMTPHVAGPLKVDVVVVTDEPVIAAMDDGQITAQAARELGLMRFYGSPQAVQDVTSWLDRSSQQKNAKAVAGAN